jgi:hypothetical protein
MVMLVMSVSTERVHGQPHVQTTVRVATTTSSYPVDVISPTVLTAWLDSQPLAGTVKPSAELTYSLQQAENQLYSKTQVQLVSDYLMGKWSKVAWCETHSNWSHAGYKYDGGLGIMPINWITYGGLAYAPAAHLATPQQQVAIAIAINGSYIPDQDGRCRAW